MGLAPIYVRRDPPDEPMRDMARERSTSPAARPSEPAATPNDSSAAAEGSRRRMIAAMGWDELAEAVANCRACRLCEQRKQAVLGVGDRKPQWLFVGEGPGAEEDARGEPFVGQAGKLLDAMLAAIGLRRGEGVYIANAVKCRPPGNRTPEASETAACLPYLERQIDLLAPRIIVALGRPAAQTLLNTEIKIAAARGRDFVYRGVPLVVTYHPAYLLRNLPDKARAWEDLLFARQQLARVRDPKNKPLT
ncbi:MAG: uracil-DNA glycosylase [Rhodocyclaceae bacterium]|nr:uracil-DNA glycosylase [Rhodocyclaceae bacterium]